MDNLDQTVVRYLRGGGPYRLEIGAGDSRKPGWLSSDLNAKNADNEDVKVIAQEATQVFPIPSDSFDFVYTEHMIEHIGFENGLDMLCECRRILKPGGTLRVVTPSLGFLYRIISPDRTPFEDRYREWSVRTFVPRAPAVTNALFLNNFVRAWGHAFVYDHETMRLSMELAGFERIKACELNQSDHILLRNLENETRMPPGFLALESMVMEGSKGSERSLPVPSGRNLALGKRATQSSVSQWSNADTPEKDASRVVGGNFTGSYNNHTALDDPAWWRVDLERVCRISQVRIYNRSADRDTMLRASRFEIHISDNDRDWRTVFRKESPTLVQGARYAPYVWTPKEPVRARFVRIQLLGPQFLHLDQVEIFGEG